MPLTAARAKVALATLAAASAVVAGGTDSNAHPTVHASCKHVKIHGHHVCLAPGKFCTRQWEKAYRRHGFTCSYLDRNDRYRLRRLHHH